MVLFVPMLGAEEKHVAPAMRYLTASNVQYFWLTRAEITSPFAVSIGAEGALWDFWGVYDRGWTDEEPPPPVFWQHQLPDLPEEKRLDVDEFNRFLKTFVEKRAAAR